MKEQEMFDRIIGLFKKPETVQNDSEALLKLATVDSSNQRNTIFNHV